MNCATCKHWRVNKEDYYHTADGKTGRCSKIEYISSDSFDENANTYEMEFICKTGSLAFACDTSGGNAWVHTRSDFGCVMHE